MNYDSNVYNSLIKVLKFRFAKELENSGIEFQDFYLIKNQVTGEESYLLKFNNTKIQFVKPYDFVIKFIDFLSKSTRNLDVLYSNLINRKLDRYSDELQHEYDCKMIDYHRYKQRILLKKFQERKRQLI